MLCVGRGECSVCGGRESFVRVGGVGGECCMWGSTVIL